MNGRNKAKVLRLYPDALLHPWEGKQVVSIDAPGFKILGDGKTPAAAWRNAFKNLSTKKRATERKLRRRAGLNRLEIQIS